MAFVVLMKFGDVPLKSLDVVLFKAALNKDLSK
jgi:hypothetical protein